jgi:hypothetical protein
MGVDHPVDRQILNGDQVELTDDATTLLMSEVTPSPGNAFIDSRHYTPASDALRRALFLFAEVALRLGQRLFSRPEEAWIGDYLPVAQGGEGRAAHVNAYGLSSGKQRRWFDALAGETDVRRRGDTS